MIKFNLSFAVAHRLVGISLLLLIVTAGDVFAQHGGKAEPKRIEFSAGTIGKVLSGKLSNGQEMEYVFSAKKGQNITVKNSTTSLFDFRIFSAEFDVETEFESSKTLTIEAPGTGDYMFFVRKKQVKAPRSARFSMTISIK